MVSFVVNNLTFNSVGVMLLTKDPHGDIEFYKLTDTKYGQEVGREAIEDLEVNLERLEGKTSKGYAGNISGIAEPYFRELAEIEFDSIEDDMESYRKKKETIGLFQLLEEYIPYRLIEFENMLKSYIRIYTYYKLAYGEGITLSEMKRMLEQSRRGIF